MSHNRVDIFFMVALCLFGLAGTASADRIDAFCTQWNGVQQIQSGMPIGQEFVPTAELNVGLDLRLCDFNTGAPPAPVTVLLREGTIDGPVVSGSAVTVDPDVPASYAGAWEPFKFDAPLSLSVGATYVVDVSTTTGKWGWVSPTGECYEAGGSFTGGNWGPSDKGFRTWVSSQYGPCADLTCEPSSGVLPFVTSIRATLGHGDYNRIRRIAARLDVQIASGTFFSSWRAGYTNTSAVDPFVLQWLQNIPLLGTLVGDNIFTLNCEDVTPAPFNQPPFPPSGGTDTSSCTVEGNAP